MILLLLACAPSEPVNQTHLSDVVETLELVVTDPAKTVQICQTLPFEHRDQCYLLGAEHLQRHNPEEVEKICPLLQSDSKGECWFRLAEKTNNNIFCILATPYEQDCQLHLLSRQLFRSKSDDWNTILGIAKEYQVDPTTKGAKLFCSVTGYPSQTPFKHPLRRYIDENACIMAAESLYRDRLRYAEHQKTFSCSSDIPLNMQHQESPELTEIFDEFKSVICD